MAIREDSKATQKVDFKSGNEVAAKAISQINYHMMGFFPITPSTEVAEYLDEMKAAGEHDVHMVPGDGEHGSAGICYGGAVAGGRVVNATSSQGFMYMIEQLPVQAGTRFPMVLNLVTRAVSGPLDIRGDHSDLYYAWNLGWPILMAKDPQAVYDMNIMALKLAEHPDVRLPVLVVYDGFFTSHQKRRVEYFTDREIVQNFVGPQPAGYTDVLDLEHPVSIGAYMNGDDYITNKWQQSEAMYRAEEAFEEIAAKYEKISGRSYTAVDSYRLEDAEIAVCLLNSASDTAREVADELRVKGIKAGVLSFNMLRPFSVKKIQEALKNVKAMVVGDRADSYGAHGGQLAQQIKAALQEVKADTVVLSRIYGLGGVDFTKKDAYAFFDLCLHDPESQPSFDYFGDVIQREVPAATEPGLPRLKKEQVSGFITVTQDAETGKLNVKVPPLRNLTAKARRISSGHGACPGCGALSGIDLFLKGIEGDVVLLFQTGCAMITTTGYPYTAHRVTYVHNLFQNGAATISGIVEMFLERQRRGEIPATEDVTFIMVTGDGGMDIGMGAAMGAANRNHRMIVLEYDNEGYMNTGAQLSYSTPIGQNTSTSHAIGKQTGKAGQHKDTPQIFAAAGVPYVFTAVEAQPQDLLKKAAKAQWYANHEGFAYGKILSSCPLNWGANDDIGTSIVQVAVDSCFFPLYEVEHGVTKITYNPETNNKRIPVSEWLKLARRSKHLLKPENASIVEALQNELERRWARLKARDEHPLL